MRQFGNHDVESDLTEVELNAQDLVGLAHVDGADHPTSGLDTETESVRIDSLPQSTHANVPGSAIGTFFSRASLTLVIALTAAVATAAFYKAAAPERKIQPFKSTWNPMPDPITPEPVGSGSVEPPVRFTNPFDKTEVFEFPPGTSKAEARAAVADILTQRAIERRQTTDKRISGH